MGRANDWQSRFGAARRAKDRAYCQEAERAIAAEERAKLGKAGQSWCDADTRAAIAKAFGRPLN
jgi:hypothetical protein